MGSLAAGLAALLGVSPFTHMAAWCIRQHKDKSSTRLSTVDVRGCVAGNQQISCTVG